MHDLLERAGGDIATALAAYNAGPAVIAGRLAAGDARLRRPHPAPLRRAGAS